MSVGGIILTICINLIVICALYIFQKRDIDRRLKHVKTEIQELEDLVSAIIAEFEAIADEVDQDSVGAGGAEEAAMNEGISGVQNGDEETVTERIIAEVEAALENPDTIAAPSQILSEREGGGDSLKDQDFEAEQTVLESTHSESSSSTVGVVIPEEQQVSDEETISCPTNVAKAVSSNHTERDLQVPQDESEPQLPLTFSGPEPVAPSSPTQPVISDPRHRRVYELWRRGLTVEEIAKELGTGRGEIQLLLYQWTVKR
ncbi:MAG TPA: hypothetical protein VF531_08395 [Bacillota bacterium]